MRAQIRELTRPATLLAAVLVSVSPSPAAGLPRDFVAHSNQEDHQNAHSNQETTVGLGQLLAGWPAAPAELYTDVEAEAGFGLRGASSRAWVDVSMPPDAGEQGAADAVIGLGAPDSPGGGPGSGESALAPRPQSVIPTPGGLGLLALAALAGGRRRRRRGRRA
jgi:hypothetical protein